MLVADLIRELETYPPDWPVRLEVNGVQNAQTDIDYQVDLKADDTRQPWVVIHDYAKT